MSAPHVHAMTASAQVLAFVFQRFVYQCEQNADTADTKQCSITDSAHGMALQADPVMIGVRIWQ